MFQALAVCDDEAVVMTEPLHISWSALRTQSECKQKGHLFRLGKKTPGQDVRPFFHGTVVDRIMREWLSAPEQVPGKMVTMVDDFIESCEKEALETGDGVVRWKSPSDRKDVARFCVELVTKLEPILRKLVLPFEYEPAKRFSVPVQIPYLTGEPTWVLLVGEMDLLTRNDKDLWAIYDLKATRNDSYWRKTLGQMVFYDLSLAAMFDSYATYIALIQPMCKEPVLGFTFTDDDRRQMWSRIVRFANDIWTNDVDPKKDMVGCDYCPAKHACAKFTPVHGNRMNLIGLGNLL